MRLGLRGAVLVLAVLAAAVDAAALDLQGHRGARGLLPENTLAGFEHALKLGVTTLELDLGVSRDGTVVVAHDRRLAPHLTRDAGGNWVDPPAPAIHALSFAQLRSYDVGRLRPGSGYAKRYSRQRPRDGARIPALAEVFELAARLGRDTVQFNVETKLDPREPGTTLAPADFAAAVLAVIEAHGVASRTIVQSFDWRTLREVQRRAPAVRTAYLSAQQEWLNNIAAGQPGPSAWTAGLDVDDYGGSVVQMVKAAGGDIWSPYHREVSAALVREAHAAGLAVIVWTVNDAPRMRELIHMGVDGIISDYPDLLLEVAAPP